MDKEERERKREARKAHKVSEFAQKSFGLRAKLFNQKRFKEKAEMKKTISMFEEGSNKHAKEDNSNKCNIQRNILVCIPLLIKSFCSCSAVVLTRQRRGFPGENFI